jgi:transcriptional regulatory protein RtcR
MATLAAGGRISSDEVHDEIDRLRSTWQAVADHDGLPTMRALLSPEQIDALDLFDRAQLEVVLGVCRDSASLSDAGRKLFSVSRLEKKQANDADRLRKYLARFGLTWSDVRPNRARESPPMRASS